MENQNSKTLESFRIRRDGDTPLRFRGRSIGCAKETADVNGVVHVVELYRTASGKFVVEEYYDANHLKKPIRKAECFDSPSGAIDWLRDPESGKFGPIADAALTDAANNDDGVFAAFGETIAG